MTDSNSEHSRKIAALRRAHKDGNTSVLINGLLEPERGVAPLAAKYLGEMNAIDATPNLERALLDRNPSVRANAATALGRLGDSAAMPLLAVMSAQDPASFVRAAAVWSYGKLGESQVEGDIAKALSDRDWRVRFAALEFLGNFGTADSLVSLKQGLRREKLAVKPFWYIYYGKARRRILHRKHADQSKP